jgi:hypothetical protein
MGMPIFRYRSLDSLAVDQEIFMAKRKKTKAVKRNKEKKLTPGFQAKAGKKTLRSYEVGAMPIINHIIRSRASAGYPERVSAR